MTLINIDNDTDLDLKQIIQFVLQRVTLYKHDGIVFYNDIDMFGIIDLLEREDNYIYITPLYNAKGNTDILRSVFKDLNNKILLTLDDEVAEEYNFNYIINIAEKDTYDIVLEIIEIIYKLDE